MVDPDDEPDERAAVLELPLDVDVDVELAVAELEDAAHRRPWAVEKRFGGPPFLKNGWFNISSSDGRSSGLTCTRRKRRDCTSKQD